MSAEHRQVLSRCLAAVAVLMATCGHAAADEAPVLLPWHGDAVSRQVIQVRSEVPRGGPAVGFELDAPEKARLAVVTPEEPTAPLPIFRHGREVSVVLPGDLTPGEPRLLVAYAYEAGDGPVSPSLPDPPPAQDAYARATYGDAWDFEEGDQEGIAYWGDRPAHYGEVAVRDGRLVIPVTGPDPYFIWGVMFGDPGNRPTEHIDSGLYGYLQVRLRQSCERAAWSVYVTDTAGMYRGHHFDVWGTGEQDVAVDLRDAFPEFWDGREIRALRIDPTNNSPGCTVEIDSVRLLRAEPVVDVGPLLKRAQLDARAAVHTVSARLPQSATVGAFVAADVPALAQGGEPVPHAPLAVRLEFPGGKEQHHVIDAGLPGRGVLLTRLEETAGTARWVAGACDDLGRPLVAATQSTIEMMPGPLHHYDLVCERGLVRVDEREILLDVWGADRLGNRIPCDIESPRWQATGDAEVGAGPLRGAPARAEVLCAPEPLVTHRIVLSDEQGRTGKLELLTMAVNKNRVRIGPNGYLVESDGSLFLPLGGFYANWPTAPPDAEGACRRALDLFPCGPVPYAAGYPWTPETEGQVREFLGLAHENGVTALRLMLRNMDLVGRVDDEQLQAVLHLFDLARPLGIRFNVVLFEDYEKPPYCNAAVLDRVVLPHYSPAELEGLPAHRARFLVEKRLLERADRRYTDRGAIACQKDYLNALLPHLAAREEIFCYELENEMVRPPMSWVNEMTDYIRSIDPYTPVLGNPGPHEWPEPARWRNSRVDLFSYHPYSDGLPEADHGAVVFMRSKWGAAAGKPFFTGEGGINQNRWQQDVSDVRAGFAARGIRDQIWLSLCSGACGAFMWTPQHAGELAEFGKVRPALAAVGIDLLAMQRRRPAVAVVMPEGGSDNREACALAWELLGSGTDFDTVSRADAAGYDVQLVPGVGADLDALAAWFRPGQGYQLARLASADGSQALVYLRNVAGGIVNVGKGRACYLRRPQAAEAAVMPAASVQWSHVRAFDLDDGREVPVEHRDGRRSIVIAGPTTHDYVLGFRR